MAELTVTGMVAELTTHVKQWRFNTHETCVLHAFQRHWHGGRTDNIHTTSDAEPQAFFSTVGMVAELTIRAA